MTRRALTLCLLALPFTLLACGGAPEKPGMKAGPGIPGLNLSGLWYSQAFGDVRLVQTGRTVRGTWEDPRGPDHNGTIKATVEGDLLRVLWIKPGNPLAAIQPVRGKATLRIKQGGSLMEGRWGYDTDDTNGGPWSLEKSKHSD